MTPNILKATTAMLLGVALTDPVAAAQLSQGSGEVTTLSPAAPIDIAQPTGPFPNNLVTNRPFISPQGGQDGLRKTVGALEHALIGLRQLGAQIKEAHWNVSGSLFYPLHIQLQEQYEGVEKLTDRVAERLLAIGSSADGRSTTIVKAGTLPEIPGGFLDDAQVIGWFVGAYKTVAGETKAGIAETDKVDPTSSNLLQEVEDTLSKYQWMMRAYVQSTATDPNTGADLNNGKAVDVPAATPPANPNGG